ncbi:MAG: molybdate ABC transporter permease subunit [Crocinitomix sp.]|nr:molybdate ABC transporter permease subunit [Crocinitomix sp.]
MDYTPFLVTFKLAGLTTLILFVIGIPIAYSIAFSKWKGKIILESILMLPIVLPPTVLGFYFIFFLGPKSGIGKFLENTFDVTLTFSFQGILLGSIIYCLPFMLTPIINGFRSIPKNLIESTTLLNKSKKNALWFVFIPYIKRSILSGVLLTFAHTIGAFGLILMIGGGKLGDAQVASVAIYDEMNAMNFDNVHQYALILLVISFVLIFCLNLLTRKSTRSDIA